MTRFILLGSLIIVAACGNQKQNDLVDLDLLSHGMPIVIKAPEGAVIEKMDLVVQKDLTVKEGDDFFVQIFESDARNNDVAAIKKQLLTDVKSNPYFSEVVRDDVSGFIYKNVIDSSYVNFGFRFVKIQGDKEYIFQQGLRGKFSLEAIENMYDAVQ